MAVQSDKLRLLRRIPQIRFEEELRGYSKSQVDRVLENLAPLADEIEVLQQHLAEAEQRAASAEAAAVQGGAPAPAPVVMDTPPSATPQPPEDFDEQLREVMLMAQRTAKDRVETAEADAEQIRAESKSNADSLMASARTEAQELKGEAHAQREQMLSEAEEERAALLESTNADAEERRQAVEAQLVESEGAIRDDLLVEIRELRDKRSQLVQDLELFENHLGDRRETVKAALGEIDDAINDPAKLRQNELIEATEVPETDEASLTEISVESDALSELSGEAAKARDALAAATMAPADFSVVEAEPLQTVAVNEESEWVAPEVTPAFESTPADSGFLNTESVAPVDEPRFDSISEEMPVVESAVVESAAQEFNALDMDLQSGLPSVEASSEEFASDVLDSSASPADDPSRQGFFDSAALPDDGHGGTWDPPSMPEDVPAPPPPAQVPPSRGGLLSGLLGGRRSSESVPQVDPGDYLPPPAEELALPSSEAMSGLRSRLSGAEMPTESPASLSKDPSLAESAMNAVTEAPQVHPGGLETPSFDAAPPESSSPFGNLTRKPAPDAFESEAPDDGRPAWADAIPEEVPPAQEGDLAGGSGDQYLDELRRVTGDDAVADESDEALNRFLSEDEDQGGGWFGRRK